MINILTVRQGEMLPVDFNRVDIAATYEVESCVAVASLEQTVKKGTLSHLRLIDDIGKFMDFFRENAAEDSLVYVAGGWSRSNAAGAKQAESDIYIKVLLENIVSSGYSIRGKDILCPPGKGRNVLLRHNQPLEVQMYQYVRTPGGMQKYDVGHHLLQ